MADDDHILTDRFNGDRENFRMWQMRFRNHLDDLGLLFVLEIDEPPPPEDTENREEYEKSCKRAKSELIRWVSNDVLYLVRPDQNIREIMSNMDKEFNSRPFNYRALLRDQLKELKYNMGENLNEHLRKLEIHFIKMSEAGIHMDDPDKCYYLIDSLPKECSIIKVRTDCEQYAYTDLTLCVKGFVMAANTQEGPSSDLVAAGNSKTYKYPKPPKKCKKFHPTVRCFNCTNVGHYAVSCQTERINKRIRTNFKKLTMEWQQAQLKFQKIRRNKGGNNRSQGVESKSTINLENDNFWEDDHKFKVDPENSAN